jgi:hypothetical protein
VESLARASGDVEKVAAVMSRDLSHAYSYLKIAEVYREARQHDQALLWAEKGLNAFPETDGRLREFAAEEDHRRRRHEDAMKRMNRGDAGIPGEVPVVEREQLGDAVNQNRCDQPGIVDLDALHRMSGDKPTPFRVNPPDSARRNKDSHSGP